MSRLLSSTSPSFAQASYTPLLSSRHSSESVPDEDDLDPDSISPSSSSRRNKTPRQQQQSSSSKSPRPRLNSSASNRSLSLRDPSKQFTHDPASDSDSEQERHDAVGSATSEKMKTKKHHRGNSRDETSTSTTDTTLRDASADSSSTIVSMEEERADSSSHKYGRESFEYAEPGQEGRFDRNNPLHAEEAFLAGVGAGIAADDGNTDQRLWMQASTTLVIAVSGLICAGWLLDEVQHWDVFIEISELIILIPILLNLKGNLEMNLASRLSTASNMGLLDTPATRNQFILGNLALLQLQALTVGSVAGLFSFALGMIVHPTTNNVEEIALMISSSMLCASISSFVLGSFMCLLVLICRHYRINPETPLCVVLLLILLALIPGWLYCVRRNKFVAEVVKEGWGPVFSAMVIASTAGLTLERYINQFPGMAMVSPVLNGLTGNIGSIYASRISTALHANIKENYRSTEKTLFFVHIPIEILFLTVISVFHLGDVQWSTSVVVGYTFVALTLVIIALALAKWTTKVFWKWGYDPDNYALPILTSLIDVLGTALLVVGFWTLGYGQDAASAPAPAPASTEFAVEMTCESCVKDVTNVLEGAEGIKKFDIDLKEQRVVVEGSAPPSVVSRLLKDTGKTVIVRGSGIAQGAHSGAAVCILDINHDNHLKTVLPNSNKPYGLVRFLQVNEETCVVDVTVQGLKPGRHGIHIHELGDTSGGPLTTGGHYNPTGVDHGDEETGHVGDLGNVEVNEKGWGDLVLESRRIKVWDIIGRSMVVTEKEDDLGKLGKVTPGTTTPTTTTGTKTTGPVTEELRRLSKEDGNSGKGVICGIIARSAGMFENAKKICDCSGTTLWEEARLMRGGDINPSNDFF
ncbi:hypothetical protein EDD11_005175 [Mortierella claussenii]|nr:hypothetical protein EDD11_005175 [Mortierella claussenii]